MVASGILFVTSQFVLAGFIWAFGNYKGENQALAGGHKKNTDGGVAYHSGRPGNPQPLVRRSKVWASMYIAKPDPRALH